jgi:replicative DNA helicase
MSNNADFSAFGKNFQEGLVNLIFHERAFCDQIREIIQVSYFEFKDIQIFVKKLFEYKDKYKEHPSISTMRTVLNTELKDESEVIQEQVKELFNIVSSSDKIENAEYIRNRSLDFCKKQVLKVAMLESIDLLEKSSFDEISGVIGNALKLGLDNDIGHRYLKDFEDRFKMKLRAAVTTGWPEIDNLMKGGLGKGELAVIIGPSGAGKSMLLVSIAAAAIKAGKTVVYYSLELSDKHLGNRFDSCITGVELDELYTCKDAIYEKVKEIEGNLIIKEYPTKSITSLSIRSHLEKLRQRDIQPDLILVDYMDLLKSETKYKEKRWDLESISESLRALAQNVGCPLWTATQSNRTGLDAELVSMGSIAESFAKVFVADLVMTLSRTREDKQSNTGRLYVAKNRSGSDGMVFNLFFDPSRVCIKILDEKKEEVLSEEEKEVKTEKKIKQSYKKFLQSQNSQ